MIDPVLFLVSLVIIAIAAYRSGYMEGWDKGMRQSPHNMVQIDDKQTRSTDALHSGGPRPGNVAIKRGVLGNEKTYRKKEEV